MPREIDGKTYLTQPEAAKQVGVSRWTLNRWLAATKRSKKGSVQMLKDKVSGRTYIAKDSLAVLRSHRFEPTSVM